MTMLWLGFGTKMAWLALEIYHGLGLIDYVIKVR